jgi:hypothetical protein
MIIGITTLNIECDRLDLYDIRYNEYYSRGIYSGLSETASAALSRDVVARSESNAEGLKLLEEALAHPDDIEKLVAESLKNVVYTKK